MMETHQYERRPSGLYVLRDATGSMVIKTEYPAILFDRDDGSLHKHGDVNRIRNLALDMKSKYVRVNALEMAKQLTVYASRNFPVEELNRCLSITGYCKILYERVTRQ